MNYGTICVHAGGIQDEINKGIVSPVYPGSAYDYEGVNVQAYPRYFNIPNQRSVVDKLVKLENGEDGLVFSSGMAAISTTLFSLLKSGDHAIFQNDLYGGTHQSITYEMDKYGIEYTFVDATNSDIIKDSIKKNTRLVYIETPSNPLLKIIDLSAIAGICKSHNLISVIDNTFASPINQRPIDHGIDIVTHSGTKYLGGHSDLCCGVMISSKEFTKLIWNSAIHFGGSLDHNACFLLERSLKTLWLRIKQQNNNAMAIAQFLDDHKKVRKVYYPGLESHPGHQLAVRQMNGFGGMMSFEVDGDADNFIDALDLISRAMSLGGVESTICSPAVTSHSKMSKEEREKAGISDRLLRLSVGIEDSKDLLHDLGQALDQC